MSAERKCERCNGSGEIAVRCTFPMTEVGPGPVPDYAKGITGSKCPDCDGKELPAVAPLLPAVPPYQNGEDSAVGNRRFQQSDACLEHRLAMAINTAIHFLDYHSPQHAAQILRDARADYLRMRQ